MSNIILPDDPEWNQPLKMNDPYKGDHLPPKMAQQKRIEDLEENSGGMRYGATQIAHVPDPWFTRMNQASLPTTTAQSTGVSNMMTQPMWFSPLHTPQNWQIASKRREIYQWSFISPCYLTVYGSGELINIENVYTNPDNCIYIQNNLGQKAKPDKITRRQVKKKANRIKILSVPHVLEVTHDHKCIVVKREDVKCVKGMASTSKNCIPNVCSSTCLRAKCDRYKNIDYKISKMDAKDVKKGDYFLVPFPTEIKKSVIKTKEQARFVGHLAADGSVSDKSFCTRICMNIHEMAYVYPSVESVYSEYGVKSKLEKCTSDQVKEWRTGKRSLYREFTSKVVKGKKETKRFTEEVVLLDPKLQKHVLGAYIQSDGSYNKINGQIEITTVSKHLANQLQIMFYRCGILSFSSRQPRRIKKSYPTKNKFYYIISVPKTFVYTLKDYVPGKIPDNVYTPVHKSPGLDNTLFANQDNSIRRIQNRFFWKNYVVSPVVSNTSFDYEGPVYDIRVPPTHAITANGVAIHQCRFFFESDPKVAAAIDFYSRFPMNNFSLECTSRKVLKFFKHKVVDKLKLNEQFKMISSEYFMMGDVFVHTDIECEICKGSGVDEDGELCNHKGGMIKRMIILNPDWIEVQQNVLADEPAIVMVPDEELKRIVFYKQPKVVYDRIPEAVKELVAQNKPIPLSNRTMSHLKHMPVPYGTYGTSLIRRIFTTLAYKTKMMTANWIVAERLIIPVRVIKIGSDNRPASSADIADVQNQLAQTANDPNMTIITHHNFDFEWYGTTGKVLQITQEMEWVGKEILDGFMLNQSLLNGEMCYSYDTEVLTNDGFKKYDEVNKEDLILTYSLSTKRLEYQKPFQLHVYDYDGELIHFQGEQVDIMVTPNHRMLTRKAKLDDWKVVFADNVTPGMRFLAHSDYDTNSINSELQVNDISLDMRIFFKFAGYYLSEGSMSCKKSNYQVSVSQSSNSIAFDDISSCFKHLGLKYSDYHYPPKLIHSFTICNKKFVEFIKSEFGTHAHNKSIPTWMKNAPVEYLNIIIQSLMNGDGQEIKHNNTTNYVYTTISEHLANDVQEIAFKAGYNVRKVMHVDSSKPEDSRSRHIYRVKISKGKWSKGNEPRIKKHHIKRETYKGKVWCYAVPTGFFVTRRNGKITIQGNSGYQSAQVGVETLIRRIESWRDTLAEWCQERIFKPIAEMQGFIDPEESEEIGETVYLYPKIKWNDLNLKDKTQWYQLIMQLHDKGTISTQTLLEELDLDYDQEVKRKRFEMAQGGPGGAQMGGQPGGAAGGMPMGGGGGMPGGDMAGGMGGGMGGGMPSGDMGGGSMAPSGMPGAMTPMGGGGGAGGGKVLKKGKKSGGDEEMMVPSQPIMLTTIEQALAEMLSDVTNNLGMPIDRVMMQYPVQNPTGAKPYTLDFAIPHIKLGMECLHPDNFVSTNHGVKRAKDVTGDDKLIGRNGDYVSINKRMKDHYQGDLITVKTYGMLPIQVTGNHPVLISKPKQIRVRREEPTITRTREYIIPSEPSFVKASKIEKGDYILIPKRRDKQNNSINLTKYAGTAHNAHKLPDDVTMNLDLAWLLGIYAAEGCSNPNSGSGIEFSFHINETELICRTQYTLQKVFGLKSTVSNNEEDNVSKVCTSSKALARFLTEHFGIHAPNKRVPQFVFNASYEFKKTFLEAIIDGDGCGRSYDNAFRIVSSSRYLLLDLQSLCMSMGHFASISLSRKEGTVTRIKERDYETAGLWELVINFLGHIKAQYREDDNYFYLPVKKITSDFYSGDVINYETEGEKESNHTYCVGNIVTHNSDGEVWHSSQTQVEDDQKRDNMLAQRGWTVLRFDDKVIEDAPQAVKETISSYIQKLHTHGGEKHASKETGEVQLFTLDKDEKLAGLVTDYAKYNQRGMHLHEITFKSSEK